MATKTDDTILKISGIPREIEEEYIEHYFSKKCGRREAKLLSYSETDSTAVVFIKQLDSEGISINI